MENNKKHTVERIRRVSYPEKHIRGKREFCISMSYNEKLKNDKNHTVGLNR
jgi:hypothetical protein